MIGLTRDHFHKVSLVDVVYIYNQGGYCGNSTTLEIGFAVALNKPIYAQEPDPNKGCRDVLIQEIAPTTKKLLSYPS